MTQNHNSDIRLGGRLLATATMICTGFAVAALVVYLRGDSILVQVNNESPSPTSSEEQLSAESTEQERLEDIRLAEAVAAAPSPFDGIDQNIRTVASHRPRLTQVTSQTNVTSRERSYDQITALPGEHGVYVPVTVHPVTVNIDGSVFSEQLSRVADGVEQMLATHRTMLRSQNVVGISNPSDGLGRNQLSRQEERLTQIDVSLRELSATVESLQTQSQTAAANEIDTNALTSEPMSPEPLLPEVVEPSVVPAPVLQLLEDPIGMNQAVDVIISDYQVPEFNDTQDTIMERSSAPALVETDAVPQQLHLPLLPEETVAVVEQTREITGPAPVIPRTDQSVTYEHNYRFALPPTSNPLPLMAPIVPPMQTVRTMHMPQPLPVETETQRQLFPQLVFGSRKSASSSYAAAPADRPMPVQPQPGAPYVVRGARPHPVRRALADGIDAATDFGGDVRDRTTRMLSRLTGRRRPPTRQHTSVQHQHAYHQHAQHAQKQQYVQHSHAQYQNIEHQQAGVLHRVSAAIRGAGRSRSVE